MQRTYRRGLAWLKLKKALATLDVVVTAVEWGHGKRRHMLSDYTFAVRDPEQGNLLLNVGKAYSGLTDAEIIEMTEWFKAHTIRDFGRVRLVEPRVDRFEPQQAARKEDRADNENDRERHLGAD